MERQVLETPKCFSKEVLKIIEIRGQLIQAFSPNLSLSFSLSDLTSYDQPWLSSDIKLDQLIIIKLDSYRRILSYKLYLHPVSIRKVAGMLRLSGDNLGPIYLDTSKFQGLDPNLAISGPLKALIQGSIVKLFLYRKRIYRYGDIQDISLHNSIIPIPSEITSLTASNISSEVDTLYHIYSYTSSSSQPISSSRPLSPIPNSSVLPSNKQDSIPNSNHPSSNDSKPNPAPQPLRQLAKPDSTYFNLNNLWPFQLEELHSYPSSLFTYKRVADLSTQYGILILIGLGYLEYLLHPETPVLYLKALVFNLKAGVNRFQRMNLSNEARNCVIEELEKMVGIKTEVKDNLEIVYYDLNPNFLMNYINIVKDIYTFSYANIQKLNSPQLYTLDYNKPDLEIFASSLNIRIIALNYDLSFQSYGNIAQADCILYLSLQLTYCEMLYFSYQLPNYYSINPVPKCINCHLPPNRVQFWLNPESPCLHCSSDISESDKCCRCNASFSNNELINTLAMCGKMCKSCTEKKIISGKYAALNNKISYNCMLCYTSFKLTSLKSDSCDCLVCKMCRNQLKDIGITDCPCQKSQLNSLKCSICAGNYDKKSCLTLDCKHIVCKHCLFLRIKSEKFNIISEYKCRVCDNMISAGPIDEVISEFYKIITKDTNIRCLDCNILVKKNQTVQAGCKHPFCKPCLKKFFKLKLEKSKPTRPIRIHCKRCSRPFPDDFIISYLDASDKEKFKSSLTISSSTSEKPVQLTQDKPVQLTQGKPVQLTQDKPVQLTQDKPASKEKIRLPCGDEHLVDLLRTQFEKQIQEGDFRFKCPKGCNKRLSLSSLKRSMCNSSISLDVILKGLKGEVILFTCPFCGKEYSQDMKSEKLVCSLCEVIFCTGCEKLSYKFQRGEMHHQACYFSSNS